MPAEPPHTYDAESPKPTVVSVTRDSTFQIDYVMSDGTGSSFRCTQAFADFVIEAWSARHSISQIALEKILEELQELSLLVKEIRDAG